MMSNGQISQTTTIGSGPSNWQIFRNGTALPVILDLDGNGINIDPLGASSAQFDMNGDGVRDATAWAGRNDGILAIDVGEDGSVAPDGVIDQSREIDFGDWAPGATSDMAALRQVFDTNHNGWLDAGDAQWSSFRIWQDRNGDGVSQPGEVKTLTQLGITGIDLNPAGPGQQLPDGSMIQGLSSYTRADGTTGTAADVALSFAPSMSGMQAAASSAPILLSNGTSADAGAAQLINALAGHPAGESDFEPPDVTRAACDPTPVPTLVQAFHP
jgi:hypothetical protein